MHVIKIIVTISPNPNGPTYPLMWSYAPAPEYPDPKLNGSYITLQKPGLTQIIYQLDSTSAQTYELIYANMAPLTLKNAATHQIMQVTCLGDSIVILDRNGAGSTGFTPFGLNLIARPIGDIHQLITSPDPGVDNDPPPPPPRTGP